MIFFMTHKQKTLEIHISLLKKIIVFNSKLMVIANVFKMGLLTRFKYYLLTYCIIKKKYY